MQITGNHSILSQFGDVLQDSNHPWLWLYIDAMGELHQVRAASREEAREKIDARLDRKQVKILKAELDRMKADE